MSPPTAPRDLPYATPEALERVENRARDDRVTLEKSVEERFRALRELLDERDRFRAEALALQATEYGRRLDVLNHAHQAAVEAAAKTVPRELFDQYRATQETALAALASATQKRTDEQRTDEQNYRKRMDERLAAVDLLIAGSTARATGGKETSASIRTAVQFGIAIITALLGVVGFALLRR